MAAHATVLAVEVAVEIHYKYLLEDFEEITEAAYKAYPRWARQRAAYLVLGVILLFLPFLAGGSLHHPDWSLWWVPAFGVGGIYAGLETPKRVARKKYGSSIYPYEYYATISSEGIVTRSPTVRTELKWEAFSHSIESPQVIALVYEGLMYVFPRRAFTEAEWLEFKNLIQERVPQAKTFNSPSSMPY